MRRTKEIDTAAGLYTLTDLLSLLVVAGLRIERDMSLEHIRRVVEHLLLRGYQDARRCSPPSGRSSVRRAQLTRTPPYPNSELGRERRGFLGVCHVFPPDAMPIDECAFVETDA